MGWTVEQARRISRIAPTPNGKGLTATIKVMVRDSGVTEVNGTPVWTAYPETGVAEAIAALLVEFYKGSTRGGSHAPMGQRVTAGRERAVLSLPIPQRRPAAEEVDRIESKSAFQLGKERSVDSRWPTLGCGCIIATLGRGACLVVPDEDTDAMAYTRSFVSAHSRVRLGRSITPERSGPPASPPGHHVRQPNTNQDHKSAS